MHLKERRSLPIDDLHCTVHLRVVAKQSAKACAGHRTRGPAPSAKREPGRRKARESKPKGERIWWSGGRTRPRPLQRSQTPGTPPMIAGRHLLHLPEKAGAHSHSTHTDGRGFTGLSLKKRTRKLSSGIQCRVRSGIITIRVWTTQRRTNDFFSIGYAVNRIIIHFI
jgi:hypothetical protein